MPLLGRGVEPAPEYGGSYLASDGGGGVLGLIQGPPPSLEDDVPYSAFVSQPPPALTFTIELREGGVVRASRVIEPGAVEYTDFFVLTAAEIASVVDPRLLQIWVTADAGGEQVTGEVTQAHLSIPPTISAYNPILLNDRASGLRSPTGLWGGVLDDDDQEFPSYLFGVSVDGSVTVTPDVGGLVITGFEPTIGLPVTVTPSQGDLTINGFAPVVGLPVTVLPGFGSLLVNGFAPTIGLPVTVLPGTGLVLVSGFPPVIGLPVTVLPDVGLVLLDGYPPTIDQGGVVVVFLLRKGGD